MRSVLLTLSLSLCVSDFMAVAFPLTPTPTRQRWSQIDSPSVVRGAMPTFPPSPPSCPICAQRFPSIDSWIQAAPAFANVSQIIFAPGGFIDLIKCACTDTLQGAFPQCADCFQKTNQTGLIDPSGDNVPSVISSLRSACALASTILGNANGTPSAVPAVGGAIAMSPFPHSLLLLNMAMALRLAFVGSITL